MQLIQTTTNVLTDSLIFQKIAGTNTFEWLTDTMAKSLDIEYYLNHSTSKNITPLFLSLWRFKEKETITETEMYTQLTSIILNKYADKWQRLYDAYIDSTYKPLENYSMIEQENTKVDITNTQNNGVYGFNSTNVVPSSDVVNSTQGDAEDNERKLTRSGNIGVTTSQQMLQSEIDLRQYNFIEQLYKDVDSILCLSIY